MGDGGAVGGGDNNAPEWGTTRRTMGRATRGGVGLEDDHMWGVFLRALPDGASSSYHYLNY